MKKIVLIMALIASSLLAEVITIKPYIGEINYDKNPQKSIKNYSTMYGLYTSIGTLKYLLQLNYSKFTTKYKPRPTPIPDLNQDDITQIAPNYIKKTYFSYSVSDTIFYKSFFIVLRGYGGKMRTGVKNNGL